MIENATLTGSLTNEIDLLSELKKATEDRSESVKIDIPKNISESENAIVLEPLPIETAGKENIANEETENVIPAKDFADIIINGVDALQTKFLPSLYEKQILKREDLNKVKLILTRIDAQRKNQTLDLTETDLYLLNKADEIAEYAKTLPLTTEEKNNIRKPLIHVLSNVNFKTSPETALITAALMVFLPRLLPLINNLTNKNEQ